MKRKLIVSMVLLSLVCLSGCKKQAETDVKSSGEGLIQGELESIVEPEESSVSTEVIPEESSVSTEVTPEESSVSTVVTPEERYESVVSESEESSGMKDNQGSGSSLEESESTEQSSNIVSEDELVRAEIPDFNINLRRDFYSKAPYRVEGDIEINNDIDYGISVDSSKVKKIITLMYEREGCVSHEILGEHYADSEDEESNYTALIKLDNGNVYYIYLIDDMCYAYESNSY